MNKAVVIGSGFSGLSCASYLAKYGMKVTVLEKNNQLGGRARVFCEQGFKFDMGPSWYWMPDIFESYFSDFNLHVSDFYNLIQLDPGFKMVFAEDEISVFADFKKTCDVFDKFEDNASIKLKKFMQNAATKYKVGIEFMYDSPGVSFLELFSSKLLSSLNNFDLLKSYSSLVKKYFKHPYLIALLEFPVLFLGQTASNMPALYTLMAYSGIQQGTFYPMGGFNEIIQAQINLCKKLGVVFKTSFDVSNINIRNGKAISASCNSHDNERADYFIASADYAYVEQNLLEPKYRNYSENYWNKKDFSPSSLIFYLGIDAKVDNLIHHNLFFDENIDLFSNDIYVNKIWPKKPLFYASCPSKTDKTIAPNGKENIFLLMPLPAGVIDSEELREKYFNIILHKLEKYCKMDIRSKIVYKRSYCVNDFKKDYYSYKGNAYGLANTVSQTANLKPKIYNKNVKNLFYTGQLTVPGPGVPPSLISGKLVADYIIKNCK